MTDFTQSQLNYKEPLLRKHICSKKEMLEVSQKQAWKTRSSWIQSHKRLTNKCINSHLPTPWKVTPMSILHQSKIIMDQAEMCDSFDQQIDKYIPFDKWKVELFYLKPEKLDKF